MIAHRVRIVRRASLALALLAAGNRIPGQDNNETVLTVHGVCSPAQPVPASTAEKKDCITEISRERFDALVGAAAPGVLATSTVKRSLARSYADLLAFRSAAAKDGLDRSVVFRETLEWQSLRAVADVYRRGLEKESRAVSEGEIRKYYLDHLGEFEELKLRRMLVPKDRFGTLDRQAAEKKAYEIAAEFRERAAKGEDLDALQKEAWAAAGLGSAAPSVEVGNRRRGDLTAGVREDVFALRAGQVSRVENETYSFVVYQAEARRTLPLELVRDEIASAIARAKFEAAIKSVTDGVRTELNEAYFGGAGNR